jgi:NADH dehydrogenase
MAVRSQSRVVCVLGGTGFVGRRLASFLSRAGWSVLIPTRNRERNKRLLVLPGVDLVQADVHDFQALSELLKGCHAAINLVGILNEKGHSGAGFRAVHVTLTESLVRACQERGVRRLLQMSALKANRERGPSHYLRTKGEAEELISGLAGHELQYTIFQPSVIFGPEDSFINRFARLLKLSPILPLPRLDARFAPVFVGDVARAFTAALDMSAAYGQTYQLCGPDIYSLREVLDFIQRVLGIRRLVIELPDVVGRLQALTLEYLVPGKPFSLDNFHSLSVASVCTDNGLAALGVKAKSMETIVPTYLAGRGYRQQLSRLRRSAGR